MLNKCGKHPGNIALSPLFSTERFSAPAQRTLARAILALRVGVSMSVSGNHFSRMALRSSMSAFFSAGSVRCICPILSQACITVV